uniref:Pre-mRNA-splicing factor SYF1 n=2 Tax=Macrostomum lignano TaxID=282301 RepID=A0A1I8GF51_9PLAT
MFFYLFGSIINTLFIYSLTPQEEEDLPYEEEILRNPYSVKSWLRYVEHKADGRRPVAVCQIYERAVKQLPGSYKLWYRYLRYRRLLARARANSPDVSDADLQAELSVANAAHERALVHMHKMPRIWLDYCRFLTRQGRITESRRAFDRALRSLPLTQHDRLWPPYLRLVRLHAPHGCLETALRVLRRYVRFKPEGREDFVDFLLEHQRLDEAVANLVAIINDDSFQSSRGKSKHALWQELCNLLSRNPLEVTSVNAEAIIRQGISRYTDQVGRLWTALAEWHLRAGNISRARDVFEEALATVTTVRDFSQVFDASAEFEEGLVRQLMEAAEEGAAAAGDSEESLESDLAMLRFEHLIERRPLLLNSVLLRQNPHCVPEWHKRVQLLADRPAEQIGTYMEAVKTVDPHKASAGRACTLWTEFAKFYEKHDQLSDARTVFEKAAAADHRTVDDLAYVWCQWAEMELRHGPPEKALALLAKAVAPPSHKVDFYDRSEPVQARLHKSLKLWSFYVDLEESYGTLATARAAYDRMLDLQIATPQIVINYAVMLEESAYFEEAFRVYERGIALFKWPNVEELWKTYLIHFSDRYGGAKLERARDLFEQCLEHCPAELSRPFFLLYAKLEEEHGLAKRAMNVYERALERLPANQRAPMFNIYINRVAELLGVTHTRAVYEKAIESLPDAEAREFCLRFAELETRLGEVDRARAVYAYCAQICDPRLHEQFWHAWQEFEIANGSEETLREMLRVKRSVTAAFSTQLNYTAAAAAAAGSADSDDQAEDSAGPSSSDPMRALEQQQQQSAQPKGILFVRGKDQEQPAGVMRTAPAAAESAASGVANSNGAGGKANPEELQIGGDDDDSEDSDAGGEVMEEAGEDSDGGGENIEISELPVPSEVLGSLAKDSDDES